MREPEFAHQVTSDQPAAQPVPRPESHDMRWLLFSISFLLSCWLIWGQRERNRQPGRPGLGGLKARREERGAGGQASTPPGLWTTDPQGTPAPSRAPSRAPSSWTIRPPGPAFQFGCGCPELSAQGPCEPPNPDWPWGRGVQRCSHTDPQTLVSRSRWGPPLGEAS